MNKEQNNAIHRAISKFFIMPVINFFVFHSPKFHALIEPSSVLININTPSMANIYARVVRFSKISVHIFNL